MLASRLTPACASWVRLAPARQEWRPKESAVKRKEAGRLRHSDAPSHLARIDYADALV